MKNSHLISLLFIILNQFCAGQDSVDINLKVRIYDPLPTNVNNLELRIDDFDGTQMQTFFTDSVGLANVSFRFSLDKKGFNLFLIDNQKFFDSETVSHFEITTDTLIMACINLGVKKICWDSYVVPYVYFKPNTIEIIDTLEYQRFEKTIYGLFNESYEIGFTVHLTAYVGYRESKRLARARLYRIAEDFKKHGFSWHFELEGRVDKRKDLFICEYCDGCHEEYLKGCGFTISRKHLRSRSKEERKKLDAMRSCVKIQVIPWG